MGDSCGLDLSPIFADFSIFYGFTSFGTAGLPSSSHIDSCFLLRPCKVTITRAGSIGIYVQRLVLTINAIKCHRMQRDSNWLPILDHWDMCGAVQCFGVWGNFTQARDRSPSANQRRGMVAADQSGAECDAERPGQPDIWTPGSCSAALLSYSKLF